MATEVQLRKRRNIVVVIVALLLLIIGVNPDFLTDQQPFETEEQLTADVLSESTTDSQVNWAFISLTLIGTMSYMVYEWRVELSRKLRLLHVRVSAH
jgi:hypothetical protein